MTVLSKPILANWTVERGPLGFEIVAPFADGLPGKATLGGFTYRPHAELAASAPKMAEAMNIFCNRVEKGEVAFIETVAREIEL